MKVRKDESKMVLTKAQGCDRVTCGIYGPSNAGKTRGALEMAKFMGNTTALIDTEGGSSKMYARHYDFDVDVLVDTSAKGFIEAIEGAQGFDTLIVDSMSHLWYWALATVSEHQGNNLQAWSKVSPKVTAVITALWQHQGNVICTFRAKEAWDMAKGARKTGSISPVFRKEINHEFDVFGFVEERLITIERTRAELVQLDWSARDLGQVLAGVIDYDPPAWKFWYTTDEAKYWAQGYLPKEQVDELFSLFKPKYRFSKEWFDHIRAKVGESLDNDC